MRILSKMWNKTFVFFLLILLACNGENTETIASPETNLKDKPAVLTASETIRDLSMIKVEPPIISRTSSDEYQPYNARPQQPTGRSVQSHGHFQVQGYDNYLSPVRSSFSTSPGPQGHFQGVANNNNGPPSVSQGSFFTPFENKRAPAFASQSSTKKTTKPLPRDEIGQERQHHHNEGGNRGRPAIPDSELLPHQPSVPMPQITGIEVQCSKRAMQVRIQFDQPFNGVIYTKGYHSDSDCRYVPPNSQQSSYEFVIYLDRCGTAFVDQLAQGGQAYLENTVIFQNEAHVQEIWDTARRIRCLWTGQFDKTVTSNINVDMLDVISVTYSGDTVDSYMDIQLGRGPFAAPVTGLVKIGETLTMVVHVKGGDDFDVHVKECIAHDGDISNSIQLTDARGCVLKKKLMGPWQKSTPSTGGTIISYAYFQAFKFPDKMEVFLECNIEICKFQCTATCPDYPQLDARISSNDSSDRVRRRRSRQVLIAAQASSKVPEDDRVEPVRLLRGIRVVSPDDITLSSVSDNGTVSLTKSDSSGKIDYGVYGGDVCMSTPSFVTALAVTLIVLIIACLMTAFLCMRVRSNPYQK